MANQLQFPRLPSLPSEMNLLTPSQNEAGVPRQPAIIKYASRWKSEGAPTRTDYLPGPLANRRNILV